MSNATGRLVVVSGPSGSGKTTLVQMLIAGSGGQIVPSVSATTRAARPGETHGVNYFFLSEQAFAERRDRGDFLECFQLFGTSFWYGTLREQVLEHLEQGKHVVLEIDVQGMRAIRRQFPDCLTVFVRPDTWEELERRLRQRGTEAEELIQARLATAREEWNAAGEYDYQLINDDLQRAARELRETIGCRP